MERAHLLSRELGRERSAGGAGGSGLLRMGRLRNTRVVLAIMLGTVVALLGVVYYKSTGMNVSSTAELLQSPQLVTIKRSASERRFAFTRMLGAGKVARTVSLKWTRGNAARTQSLLGKFVPAKEKQIPVEQDISETCGFTSRPCIHLIGNAKMQCGLEEMCKSLFTADRCHEETGTVCKQIFGITNTRPPCLWHNSTIGSNTYLGSFIADPSPVSPAGGFCKFRPGWQHAGVQSVWHDGGTEEYSRANPLDGSSPTAAIMASVANATDAVQQRFNTGPNKDDDAVTKILKELGASLTLPKEDKNPHYQAVGQARREVDENGDALPAKIRLYDAEMGQDAAHRYNHATRHAANTEHQYQAFKANFYEPVKMVYNPETKTYERLSFDFATGKYSDGTDPQGVGTKSYPTIADGKVDFNNARNIGPGFSYERRLGKWEFITYDHSYAMCQLPDCIRPPLVGEDLLKTGEGWFGQPYAPDAGIMNPTIPRRSVNADARVEMLADSRVREQMLPASPVREQMLADPPGFECTKTPAGGRSCVKKKDGGGGGGVASNPYDPYTYSRSPYEASFLPRRGGLYDTSASGRRRIPLVNSQRKAPRLAGGEVSRLARVAAAKAHAEGKQGWPREGKGVIYKGKYYRRGFFPKAPFFDLTSETGPKPKPFGKTNIMWEPNPQDCGGGSEYYDYGCWEPADEAFELAPLDDNDPKYVTLKWCDWAYGSEMVPCVPGFGGSYYEPGKRANDRGIWPQEPDLQVHKDAQAPVEVYAGQRSDPYLYEEGRGIDDTRKLVETPPWPDPPLDPNPKWALEDDAKRGDRPLAPDDDT